MKLCSKVLKIRFGKGKAEFFVVHTLSVRSCV